MIGRLLVRELGGFVEDGCHLKERLDNHATLLFVPALRDVVYPLTHRAVDPCKCLPRGRQQLDEGAPSVVHVGHSAHEACPLQTVDQRCD